MKLLLIFVACFVTTAMGQNATDKEAIINSTVTSCAQQIDSYQMCQLKELPLSPEGKLMKDRIDGIYEKCVGSMPKNCTVFWRTADECFHTEMDKAARDPQMIAAKRQRLQMLDSCFQRTPNDPFADLFEELYPEMLLFDDGGMKPQQQIGFGGRKFLPPPQCAPSMDNLQCVSKEMADLAQDQVAQRASAVLRRLKRGCNDKLSSECIPQSPPLWFCVDRVMKQVTRHAEDAMQRCMHQKGFTLLLRQAQPTSTGFQSQAQFLAQPGAFSSSGQQFGLGATGGFPTGSSPFGSQSGFGIPGGFPGQQAQGQPKVSDWSFE